MLVRKPANRIFLTGRKPTFSWETIAALFMERMIVSIFDVPAALARFISIWAAKP